jgi:type II secretory pathway pseudopilin PulG
VMENQMQKHASRRPRIMAFTLIELIVVIGILVILIGLLIPVVSRVRQSGYQADTNAFLMQLSSACQRYYDDFKAYPGPIANTNIGPVTPSADFIAISPQAAAGFDASDPFVSPSAVTGSENLVLGLCGGLTYVSTGTPGIYYDASLVGTGPRSLNPANAKKYTAYAEAVNVTPSFLNGTSKHGRYSDDGGAANDTLIPEFVDRYPAAMPILYLRARLGVPPALLSAAADADNSVITNGTRSGPYDLNDIIGYTASPIGVKQLKAGDYKGVTGPTHGLRSIGRGATMTAATAVADATMDSTVHYPFNAYAYFRDPTNGTALTNSQTPRAKDSYIIISAGSDRVYGTSDDITSFGPLQ